MFSLSLQSNFGSNLHLQCTVGGVDQCGTVDLAQNQQSTHLMSLERQFTKTHLEKTTTNSNKNNNACKCCFQFPMWMAKDFLVLMKTNWTAVLSNSYEHTRCSIYNTQAFAFNSWKRGAGVPCCRPGAGQCSRSHPAASGQPWPGEGGWLHDRRGITRLSRQTS